MLGPYGKKRWPGGIRKDLVSSKGKGKKSQNVPSIAAADRVEPVTSGDAITGSIEGTGEKRLSFAGVKGKRN